MRLQLVGGAAGLQREINVIPMIDILLVLLIVLLLLQQTHSVLALHLPPPGDRPLGPGAVTAQLVLDLRADGSCTLNGTPVAPGALAPRLAEVLADRPVKLLFVRVAPGRRYGEVIDAVDLAKGAGAQAVGLLPAASARQAGGLNSVNVP